MSYEPDETYKVYNVVIRRARKEHRCCACGESIQRTHRYASVHIVDSEGANEIKRCLRCQAIHEAIIRAWRASGDYYMWPDERLNCGSDWKEEHGSEPPDDVARLAFLTPDDVQRELGPQITTVGYDGRLLP